MPLKKPTRLTHSSIDTMNVLIYGDQGTGKTVFGASAADVDDMKEVLFMDVEGGLISVNERDDLLSVEIASISEASEVLWALATGAEDYKGIKTVVLDSVTALQEREVGAIRKRKGRKPNETDPRDWAEAAGPMREFLRGLRGVKVNTVVIARAKEEYEGDFFSPGPLKEIRPDLTGSVARALMGYQDFVFFLKAVTDTDGKVTRYALTRDFKKMRAKCRNPRVSEALGLFWEAPSIPKLYEVWKGGEAPESVKDIEATA